MQSCHLASCALLFRRGIIHDSAAESPRRDTIRPPHEANQPAHRSVKGSPAHPRNRPQPGARPVRPGHPACLRLAPPQPRADVPAPLHAPRRPPGSLRALHLPLRRLFRVRAAAGPRASEMVDLERQEGGQPRLISVLSAAVPLISSEEGKHPRLIQSLSLPMYRKLCTIPMSNPPISTAPQIIAYFKKLIPGAAYKPVAATINPIPTPTIHHPA